MLYYIILHCIILYHIILYYSIVYYITLHYINLIVLIGELLEDDLLRGQMGAAARIQAESLGWDSSADSLLRCFKELIEDTSEPVISLAGD